MAIGNQVSMLASGLVTFVVGLILLVVAVQVKDELTGDNATVELDGIVTTLLDVSIWIMALLSLAGLLVSLITVFQKVGGRR